MPYLRVIADLYLKNKDGPGGSLFSASKVCKYTHGGTTMDILDKGASFARIRPMYLYAELHKALYDKEELTRLMEVSGYPSYIIFTTIYPKDKKPLPVNIGFYASNIYVSRDKLVVDCAVYMTQFGGSYIDSKKVVIL